MPDFEFHHLPPAPDFTLAIARTVRRVEIISGVQHVRSLLVVIEHEVSAHRGYRYREADSQAPSGNIKFVDCLVANVAVPCIPYPMPVVMEAVAGKRLERSGSGPQIVIHAGRNRLHWRVADRGPPFVTKRPRHINVADGAVMQMIDSLQHARIRTRLAAVLANPVVLFYRSHQLPPFKPVMRAGLFHEHIFAGLAAPNPHERVPMIGCGDGDSVYIFILQQPADVRVGLWPWHSRCRDFAKTLVQDAFIYIAQGGDLCSRNARITVNVIIASTSHSANRHPDSIIRAQNSSAQCECRCPHGYCFSRRLQEVTSIDGHALRLCAGITPAGRIVYRSMFVQAMFVRDRFVRLAAPRVHE